MLPKNTKRYSLFRRNLNNLKPKTKNKVDTVGTVLSAAVVVNFENFSKGKLL